ncbi:MAG TPA: glycosyl hydrolase [Steroidobacteraceae bacterium]
MSTDRREFLCLAAGGLAAPLLGLAKEAAPGLAPAGGDPGIAAAQSREQLARLFASPPASASPGAYWYWLGGQVTREGITADLEAMRAAGIGTPILYSIGKSGPDTLIHPPADALTPHWWELVEHAAAECGRLGMRLSLNDCDGWATASGPWITPELSMQCVVWSHRTIADGETPGALAQPPCKRDYYRDIATLALPWQAEWDETSFTRHARISTDLPLKVNEPARITDPDNRQQMIDWRRVADDRPSWIEYAFERPFTLRSITVRTPSPPGFAPGVYRAANSLVVEASDDGSVFHRIGALEYPRHGWQTDLTTLTHAVPQTTARYFRLVHQPIPPQPYEEEYDFGQDTRLRLFSVVLSSEPRIHQLPGKSGAQWAISRRTTAADVPDTACIPLAQIIDLTGRLRPDGTLDWRPPPGRWRLLRIGYSTTGAQNSAAGGAQGLECDKLSAAAATLQFQSWFGQALQRIGPQLAGKVLHVVHVDSWEAGSQNWSPVFAGGFRRLRGYDLLPYIAVMTGVPLVSADVSERVLHDVRCTINDLMDTGFFRTMGELAHRHGCLLSAEPPNPTFPADGMQHFQYADRPMGEFWLRTPRNDKPTYIKDAVCGARLYGKPYAQAEAFTEGLIRWDEHPFMLKPVGDHNYCEGIGRLFLHVYAQQPWLHREPGITLNGIGTFFSRTQTWWRPGKAWLDYLRRCQALLQQGQAVTDVCYFGGENIPARAFLRRQLSVTLPEGYAFDTINRDALLRLTSVSHGEIVLSSGPRYRVLVLPESDLMTPEVALRLRELVRAGATLVGPRPKKSPSLTGYPTADLTVESVARELWGDLDGKQRTRRSAGAGNVIWGRPLEEVLHEAGRPADVVTVDGGAPAPAGEEALPAIEWTHRRMADWDLYFLSNPAPLARRIEATFRVSGRVPELWHPDSGSTETLGLWREQAGCTTVPLQMDPCGSAFVVFARPSPRVQHFVAIEPATTHPDPDDPSHGEEARRAVRLLESDGRARALVSSAGRWMLRSASGERRPLEVAQLPPALSVSGPWKLTFPRRPAGAPGAGRDARPVHAARERLSRLVSWTELSDPYARYFSGTVLYRTRLEVPAALLDPQLSLWLDLGEVHEIAAVRVNGTELGVLWKPPFALEITAAVRAGRNSLTLRVTNTWRNRLIGDHGKPAAERETFVVPMLRKGEPWLPGGPGAGLSPAGVLGPVTLRSLASVLL